MSWKSDCSLYGEEPPLPEYKWNTDHSLPDNLYILSYSFTDYREPGVLEATVNGVTIPFSMHCIAHWEQPQMAFGRGQDVDHLRAMAHSILAWEFTGQYGREAAEDYASLIMDRFIDAFLLFWWTAPPVRLGTWHPEPHHEFMMSQSIDSTGIHRFIQDECMDIWNYDSSIHKIGSWIDLDGMLPND